MLVELLLQPYALDKPKCVFVSKDAVKIAPIQNNLYNFFSHNIVDYKWILLDFGLQLTTTQTAELTPRAYQPGAMGDPHMVAGHHHSGGC